MLTRKEARARSELLRVHGYELDLDLTGGAETFRSTTRVSFSAAREGASTFVEHQARRIISVRLNGVDLRIDGPLADGRIQLHALSSLNELVVESEVAYSPTPDGLCRSVDPADDEAYVFSHCFLDAAPRVFACFDQPDLKAPFTIRVHAPARWTAVSNSPGTSIEPGRWAFEPTPPLPTYLVAIAAGPWHRVSDAFGDLPLSVYCRRSFAPFLEAEQVLDVTKRGLAFFEDLFATPYPYAKYDQIFIPYFGEGAMENAACTTLGEDLLFRSRVTDVERKRRTTTVLHELAHMWFGDLVSIPWWDDLWLNESFATYMSYAASEGIGDDPAAWARSALSNEIGYRQDEMPTTHPIVDTILTTDDATLNFDGISYQKGAGVIGQLVAWIGEDAFRAGIARYIGTHAHGSASLAELLEALEGSSDRDLGSWADAWLRSPSLNTLGARPAVDGDGGYASFAVAQSAPDEHPTLRPHRITVDAYDRVGDELRERGRHPVEILDAGGAVDALAGEPEADLVLIDGGNLTWARRRLDPRSLDTLLSAGVSRLRDPRRRAAAWLMLRDLALEGELPVRPYLATLTDGIGTEPDPAILDALLAYAHHAIERLSDDGLRDDRRRAFADRSLELAAGSESGGDHQLMYARGFIGTAVDPGHADVLERWMQGRDLPLGLGVGTGERWAIVGTLASVGRLGREEIEAELQRDPTSSGHERALVAMAGLPSAAEKRRAWTTIFDPDEPLSERTAVARAFWRPDRSPLLLPYLDELVAALVDAWRDDRVALIRWVTLELMAGAPPEPGVIDAVDEALASGPRSPFRRALREARWELGRTARARMLDHDDASRS